MTLINNNNALHELMVKKTVAKVDCDTINHAVIHFTDGTSVSLDIEYLGSNLYGMSVTENPTED